MIHNTQAISDFIFVENSVLTPCEVILVPGGSRPQLAEKAAELFSKGMAKYILFSGSANYRIADYPNEAEYLKAMAMGCGVPEDRIICEPNATHTIENAEFSMAILREMKIDISKVILVCKAFHSRRALLSYQYIFPESTEFLVATTVDNNGFSKENWTEKPEFITRVMSEVEKIGKYFSGKIFCTGELKGSGYGI